MRFLAVTLAVSLAISTVCGIAIDENGHHESKRAMQLICAAELYEAPLSGCCKIPVKLPEAALKKCLLAQNKKTLKDSEPMCTMDCIYKEHQWVSSAGVIDTKTLTTSATTNVDKAWAGLLTNAINNCSKQITNKGTNLKIISGYKTKCNPQAYIMQNCVVLELYKTCPNAFKGKATGIDTCPVLVNTMSMTCGPFAHFTNAIAEAAKSAGEALKSKAKDINAAIPAEVKKVVNVNELGKVLSQQASKYGEQLKQFKPEDMMKKWFGK